MLYARRIWLRDPDTDNRWDLTPEDPNDPASWAYGAPLIAPSGFGFEKDVKQTQIGLEYFVTSIVSKNVPVTGTLYFFNDQHVENFARFVGDTKRQFELHYSPDGSVIAEDRLSPSWHKDVILTKWQKSEKDAFGAYQISVTFLPQSDAWRRRNSLVFSPSAPYGEAHVYPYFYTFYYGGRNVLATDIKNIGIETYPTISIRSVGGIITNPEWLVEHTRKDALGNTVTEIQRGKWLLAIADGDRLEIDSRPITQRAYLYHANNVENVKNLETPDYAYIGYISLKHGDNRLIFNIDNPVAVEIKVSFDEIAEIL